MEQFNPRSPLPPICSFCGHLAPAEAHFCTTCGRPLPSAPAPEAEKRKEAEPWPWQVLWERHLALTRAPKPLQAILYVLIAQIILMLFLLITQHLPQPLVDSGVLDTLGGRYVAPLALFVVLNVSLAVSFWFTLAGALRVRWLVGLPIVAGVLYVLGSVPMAKLLAGVGEWERRGQLALLAVLGGWALVVMLRQTLGRRPAGQEPIAVSGPPGHAVFDPTQSFLLRGGSFLGVLCLLGGYYALELLMWFQAASAGQIGLANTLLFSDLATQTVTLTTLLIIVLLLGSTDMLEWGEMAAQSGWRLLEKVRVPWLLWSVTLLAAGLTIWKVLSAGGSWLLFSTAVAAALALLLWALSRVVPLPEDWSADDLRTPMVRIGALLTYVYLILISQVTNTIGIAHGLLMNYLHPLALLIALPIALAALAVSLFVLLQRRMRDVQQKALWLFVVLILLMLIVATLPDFLSAAHLPAFFPLEHLQSGIQLFAGQGVLIWAFILIMRNPRLQGAGKPLGNALLLLVGLQMVFWIQNLLDGIASLQGSSTFWLAVLFVLLSAWGLFTSGDTLHMTRKPKMSPPFYPREGVLLLYAGYTLIATVLLLYLGSLQFSSTGALAPADFSTDFSSPPALSVLGSLIAIMAFLLRSRRPASAAAHANAAARSASSRVPPRVLSWSILASGLLLSLLLLSFALTDSVPRLVQKNTQDLVKGYSAAIPGPECDSGGATWTLTPNASASATCQSRALQVTDGSQLQPADIAFLPPNGQLPANYSASVQLNLSQMVKGCVGLLTRFSKQGGYESKFCDNGDWILSVIASDGNATVLATGVTLGLKIATLGVIAQGANQRLTVNGRLMATVSDTTQASGGIYLRVVEAEGATAPASARFSHFAYAPLPASAPTRPSAYRAARPGSPCDTGSAQWALKTPVTSELRCLTNGLQMSAHQFAILEFTPPEGLLAANYRFSLTAEFSPTSVSCLGLITRATGPNFYWSRVCSNILAATWSISRNTNGSAIGLKEGTIAPARAYTITVSAVGAHLTLAVNGHQLTAIDDPNFANTAYVGIEALDLLPGQAATVVVRDFGYEPLG